MMKLLGTFLPRLRKATGEITIPMRIRPPSTFTGVRVMQSSVRVEAASRTATDRRNLLRYAHAPRQATRDGRPVDRRERGMAEIVRVGEFRWSRPRAT